MSNPPPAVEPKWTILGVIQWAAAYLKERGIESPRSAAEILLAHALQTDRVQLYVHHDQPLEKAELAVFKELIRRRVRREPVAYILGRKGFWSLDLTVGPEVLIPRSETERLVETALSVLVKVPEGQCARVLDLGTGSGAVVLALAAEAGRHRYFASDLSIAAVACARRNARAAGIGGRVDFFAADWFSAIKRGCEPFDVIVSNPPYVVRSALAELQPEIVRHEPHLALDGGPDGLNSYRAIIGAAGSHLAPGGALLLEIGSDQREAVLGIAAQAGGYDDGRCVADFAGRDRVVALLKKDVAADPKIC
ncbi:MAG TPA: peptide chain release factor N(5)-glutamine methyltransferase [Desulfobacterales bacterium]|nr:peptide chain release factor N(5)-glutamine methyltransferase [Desulfobacterales bacterium]